MGPAERETKTVKTIVTNLRPLQRTLSLRQTMDQCSSGCIGHFDHDQTCKANTVISPLKTALSTTSQDL